jgi:hypothetical protein
MVPAIPQCPFRQQVNAHVIPSLKIANVFQQMPCIIEKTNGR